MQCVKMSRTSFVFSFVILFHPLPLSFDFNVPLSVANIDIFIHFNAADFASLHAVAIVIIVYVRTIYICKREYVRLQIVWEPVLALTNFSPNQIGFEPTIKTENYISILFFFYIIHFIYFVKTKQINILKFCLCI